MVFGWWGPYNILLSIPANSDEPLGVRNMVKTLEMDGGLTNSVPPI